jgi:hypothetical protein
MRHYVSSPLMLTYVVASSPEMVKMREEDDIFPKAKSD